MCSYGGMSVATSPVDDWREAEAGVRALLRLMGENPERDGLAETPLRVVRAYMEFAARPGDPADLLKRTFHGVDYPPDEIVAVGPIPFVSICEHHLLPFSGTAWIGYLPAEKGGVVGLSKLPRLLDHYASRPQVQERLTTQVADALVTHLDPEAAGCIIRAAHSCMSLRGVKKTGASMVTSVLRRRFKTDPAMRAEFLALTRPNGHG
jgi:GTP cyclohydrolase IA